MPVRTLRWIWITDYKAAASIKPPLLLCVNSVLLYGHYANSSLILLADFRPALYGGWVMESTQLGTSLPRASWRKCKRHQGTSVNYLTNEGQPSVQVTARSLDNSATLKKDRSTAHSMQMRSRQLGQKLW